MNIKNIGILMVMVCVISCAHAGENSQIVNYPVLRVESDSIDFGKLMAGERASGEITVYNEGG